MKWIIKNPAPTDWRQEKWGDFHFGRSLTKYLKKYGIDVETDYFPEWNNEKEADIVLVLRGKYPYKPKRNSKNIMWNISHPSSVKLEEYENYDLVFVASNKYAHILKEKIKVPVYPLLQCTDTEEFFERDKYKRNGIIFVGNTRGVRRDCAIWSTELNIPLKIWGIGWEKWVKKKYIVNKYIRNEDLGNLYSKSSVVLNDHWSDMKKFGFINNRVFDAIACGLPVISDYHEELYKTFPNGILYYKNKQEFKKCIVQINNSYPNVKSSINKLKDIVKKDYSFKTRVDQILDVLNSEYLI
ncbi:MAG: glycosyltransferase family protein [Bacillota bacterium]